MPSGKCEKCPDYTIVYNKKYCRPLACKWNEIFHRDEEERWICKKCPFKQFASADNKKCVKYEEVNEKVCDPETEFITSDGYCEKCPNGSIRSKHKNVAKCEYANCQAGERIIWG